MQVKYKFHDFHKAAARPGSRCDMRPPALLQIIIIHSRDSTFMFTFTYTPCPGKNGPPKQNSVKCTVYNTIQ